MEKNEETLPERVIKLLKENGIIVSAEQAEELLRSSTTVEAFEMAEARQSCEPQIIKGYKVYVQYLKMSEEEMKKKKFEVAQIVSKAMKK